MTESSDTRPAMPLSVVIPVYNEAGSAARLEKLIAGVLGKLPEGSEAILVDDGSTDGSGGVLEGIAARLGVRLERHLVNRGYGAALKTGIEAARNDWIGITDADGTYPVGRLVALAQRCGDGARMAVGRRPMGQQPALRRPAKRFLNAFASYLSGRDIEDLNSGLRVFRREDAMRMRSFLPDGFSFTSTITMVLAGEGHRIDYLPITYRARVGESKIRPVRDMGGFLLLLARMALAFNPLKVFGPLSLASIGIGLALLCVRFVLSEDPIGLATTIVFIMGGVQLLAVGLLADLINRRR